MKKKVGRNDPCPCGSGKKFKKCCERKMIGKKFMARKIENSGLASKIGQATGNLTSFFKNRVVSYQKASDKIIKAAKKKPASASDEFKPIGLEEFSKEAQEFQSETEKPVSPPEEETGVPQEPLEPLPDSNKKSSSEISLEETSFSEEDKKEESS